MEHRRSRPVKQVTKFSLVLSGGGLKGLAHIGVFRALHQRGLVPDLVVGSSIGSLIGAAWATGMSPDSMATRALKVERQHVFRVAHTDMALRRMLCPAVYRREPLDALISSLIGNATFKDLTRPLLVNTVDLNAGLQVVWGGPGSAEVRVADVVFASCALPGIFPPREILGRYYVDGAVVENLPVRVAAEAAPWPVLAVNVSAAGVDREGIERQGFAATYIRGLEIVMQTQIESMLRRWDGPPLALIHPPVMHISMFAFDRTAELIDAGYQATVEMLDRIGGLDGLLGGVYGAPVSSLTVVPARTPGEPKSAA
jgi:NTE family protein